MNGDRASGSFRVPKGFRCPFSKTLMLELTHHHISSMNVARDPLLCRSTPSQCSHERDGWWIQPEV